MKVLQGVTASLAVALATGSWAKAPDVRGLTEYATPTLTIYAQEGAKARAIVRCYSFVEQVLPKVLNREPRPNGIPTYVVMPRGSVWKRYLQPGPAIASEYVPTRFANYVLVSNWLTDDDLGWAAYHESTHVFLRNQFAGHVPLWFDDGLAGLMASWRWEGSAVRLGTKTWPAGDLAMPLSRLLRIERHSPEYRGRETHYFHWQSKLFVHKALFDDADFRGKTFDYLDALNTGLDIDAAVHQAFGYGVDELHKVLNDYSNQYYGKVADLPIQWREPAPPREGRELEEFEALELLARVMLDTGVNPMRVEEVVAAAAKLQPESPSSMVLQLRLAVRDQDDAEIDRVWRRLEPLAREPQVARSAGLALFERVHEPRPDHALNPQRRATLSTRAFELLLAAERALPVDAEAAWALGHLAALLDRENSFAFQRVELAHQTMPRSADLTEVSARLLHKMGEREAMIVRLRDTLRHARTIPQILWARDRLRDAEPAVSGESR